MAAARLAFSKLVIGELERFAEPKRAHTILAEALERAGITEIPLDDLGFGLFVCGPLQDVIEREIGGEAAGRIVETLTPFFTAAETGESGVRQKRPTRADSKRLLVVVSTDTRRANRVAAHVRARVEVREVRDIFGLLEIADKQTDRHLVVLLDGDVLRARGSFATMARVLPPTTEVVLWGPTLPVDPLPMRVRELKESAPLQEVVEACLGQEQPPEPAHEEKPVVVIVDDDPLVREVLGRTFEREGRFDVVTCADGFEGLEACIDHRPALLITDLDMPFLDGAQLVALVRARFRDAAPRIVMLTGSATEPNADVDALIIKRGPASVIYEQLRPHFPDEASAP